MEHLDVHGALPPVLVGPASISVSKCIKLILPGYRKGLALLWMDLAEDRTKLCKITQWFPYVLLIKINEHRPIKTCERHWSAFIPHASRFGLPRGWKVHCYMEDCSPCTAAAWDHKETGTATRYFHGKFIILVVFLSVTDSLISGISQLFFT